MKQEYAVDKNITLYRNVSKETKILRALDLGLLHGLKVNVKEIFAKEQNNVYKES